MQSVLRFRQLAALLLTTLVLSIVACSSGEKAADLVRSEPKVGEEDFGLPEYSSHKFWIVLLDGYDVEDMKQLDSEAGFTFSDAEYRLFDEFLLVRFDAVSADPLASAAKLSEIAIVDTAYTVAIGSLPGNGMTP